VPVLARSSCSQHLLFDAATRACPLLLFAVLRC
jgi:hypothetical protein